MKKLVIATKNKNKKRELRDLLKGVKVRIVSLSDLGTRIPHVIEDGKTFRQNAIKKALKPTGVAVLQLNGKEVNQAVMHYHLHLMPRSGGGPELPVTVWELKPGDMEVIKQTAERIAAAIA